MNKLTSIIAIWLCIALVSCMPKKKPRNTENATVTDTPVTQPVEHITPTKDQADRRARSEALCQSKNIPVYANPNALFVEPEAKVTLRTKEEMVDRAIALCYVELKSEGADEKMLADFDKRYNAIARLTPVEKEFATAKKPTGQQMTDANWRAESYHVLLWALGYIDSLSYPDTICNVGEDVKHLFSRTEKAFRAAAKPRSKAEILDQADLALRLHWACVSARTKNQPPRRTQYECGIRKTLCAQLVDTVYEPALG